MAVSIAVLPGDGIGPEITAPTLEVLSRLGDFAFAEHPFGGASIDAHGTALTDETLAACREADAVLLAAVGGPKWDTTDPTRRAPSRACSACARRSACTPTCARCAPSRRCSTPARCGARSSRAPTCSSCASSPAASTSARRRATPTAPATCASTRVEEIERIARVAFGAARSKVTSVDKANVLETSRLWREVVRRVHADEFPHVELEHALVDSTAMKLITAPRHFDVILTENMFGDILSDEASVVTGSLGLLPSASIGGRRPGPVRARPRLGARHRGPGDRQPAGHVPVGRAACCATASVAKPRPRP